VSVLVGVHCTSSGSCWAVGGYVKVVNAALVNQALRWNGRTWSLVATPDPGGTHLGAFSALSGVACTTSGSCWAVGGYVKVVNAALVNQALHWNGRTWSLVATPDPAGTASGDASELLSVRCIHPASCWAVGDSQGKAGPDLSQAVHWNGTRWSAG